MKRRLFAPKDCCYESIAAHPDAQWCGGCGQPLVRCMAHAECGGLLDRDALCDRCVDLHFVIVKGAALYAPVGGSVALPFEMVNQSNNGRSLFLTGLWSKEKGDWRQEDPGWSELAPLERARTSVCATEINKPGTHQIRIMWAVSTRFMQRQENFVFATTVFLTVEDAAHQTAPTIQFSNENEMYGNVIKMDVGHKDGERQTVDAIDMHVQRMDLEERRLRLRGMENGLVVPRGAPLDFHGFKPDECVASGLPIMTRDGVLGFGREWAEEAGVASDVRILVCDPAGTVDRELSLQLSRRHFDLYIENGCLVLRAKGRNGVVVGGKALKQGERVILEDESVVEPLGGHGDRLRLRIGFTREHDRVGTVTITRDPALGETA
ncbi:FHA domain-containing protein [Qipengyuania sp. JC766]|uniref:FHA domain-containing protein n=1 Tax=Qipengyuania sp. JC766 TaxID=3232139 RepID=UPI003458C29C